MLQRHDLVRMLAPQFPSNASRRHFFKKKTTSKIRYILTAPLTSRSLAWPPSLMRTRTVLRARATMAVGLGRPLHLMCSCYPSLTHKEDSAQHSDAPVHRGLTHTRGPCRFLAVSAPEGIVFPSLVSSSSAVCVVTPPEPLPHFLPMFSGQSLHERMTERSYTKCRFLISFIVVHTVGNVHVFKGTAAVICTFACARTHSRYMYYRAFLLGLACLSPVSTVSGEIAY